MNTAVRKCSPGSHPHADQPNWTPATDVAEYIRNCNEGLETYSKRHLAKLLGMSRIQLWRAQQMAKIPDALFEQLLAHNRTAGRRSSERELAKIGHVLGGGAGRGEAEHCPHCNGLLRVRHIRPDVVNLVNDWIRS